MTVPPLALVPPGTVTFPNPAIVVSFANTLITIAVTASSSVVAVSSAVSIGLLFEIMMVPSASEPPPFVPAVIVLLMADA